MPTHAHVPRRVRPAGCLNGDRQPAAPLPGGTPIAAKLQCVCGSRFPIPHSPPALPP
ncbi:UDP-2,3-diacylglucosamine diphosphatase, partial [Xanthomonas perforans]